SLGLLGADGGNGTRVGNALGGGALEERPGLVRPVLFPEGLRLDEHRAYEASFDSLGVTLALREEDGAMILEAVGAGLERAASRKRLAAHDVSLELRRPDDPAADRDVALTFASDAPPVWVADAPPLRRGLWNVRVVFAEHGPPDSTRVRMAHSFSYTAPGPRDADAP